MDTFSRYLGRRSGHGCSFCVYRCHLTIAYCDWTDDCVVWFGYFVVLECDTAGKEWVPGSRPFGKDTSKIAYIRLWKFHWHRSVVTSRTRHPHRTRWVETFHAVLFFHSSMHAAFLIQIITSFGMRHTNLHYLEVCLSYRRLDGNKESFLNLRRW